MVLAFLKAEIKTQDLGPIILQHLHQFSSDRSLIESGDPDNASQNDIRAQILGASRGYGNDAVLFKNFPRDTKWRRVVLDDVSRLKHIGYDAFIKLTHGTCLLSVSKFPLTLSRISLG